MEEILFEDYFFDIEKNSIGSDKVYTLIIYDIINNKRRNKLAKFLQGYGFRVQKSAFEALLSKKKYDELTGKIAGYIDMSEDSIRVYKIIGKASVKTYGIDAKYNTDEVMVF